MAQEDKIDFEPIDFEPVAEEVSSNNPYEDIAALEKAFMEQNQLESLKGTALGTAKGLTLNNQDEIEARVRSLIGQQPYEKLLPEIRARNKQIEESAPGASTISELGVGFLIPGAVGAKAVQGLTKLPSIAKLPKVAQLGIESLGASATSAPLIAASNYGASEKKGMEAVKEAIPSLGQLAIAPAMNLGIKGAANLPAFKDYTKGKLEDLLGDYYKKSKKITEEGVELKGQEFQNVLAKQAEESAGELRKSLESTFEDASDLTKKAKDMQAKEIADLENKNKQLAESFKKQQELQKKIQTEKNEAKLKQLESERAVLGQKTEKFLDNSRKKISQTYNKIDSNLEKVDFNYNPAKVQGDEEVGVLGKFLNEINNDKTIGPAEKKRITEELNLYNRPLNQKDFRQLKKDLEGYKTYEGSMNVSNAAKRAYGEINKDLANQLDSAGLKDLSSQLKKVNDQYSAFLKYDETFTGKGYDAQDLSDVNTLRMLKNFGGQSAEDIRKTQDIAGLLQRINPDEAKTQLKTMAKFSQDLQEAKNFTPVIPKVNPELNKLQSLLEQTKIKDVTVSVSPEQNLAEDVFGAISPGGSVTKTKKLDPKTQSLDLQEVDRKTIEGLLDRQLLNPEADTQKLLEQFQKTKLSPELLTKTQKAAEKLDVSRMINQPLFSKSKELPLFPTSDPLVLAQQAGKATQRFYGGTQSITANMGRFTGNVVKNPGILAKYYNAVSEPVGQVLRGIAAEPNAQKRAALTYAAMQRPDIRQELEQIQFEESNNEQEP